MSTLFENAPDFPAATTPQARWDKIAWKLNTFYQQGGWFRDQTAAAFQKDHGYLPNMQGWPENCFSTALGIFVQGDERIEPGALSLLKENKKDKTLRVTNDGSLPYHVNVLSDAEKYAVFLQDCLQQDGIKKDLLLTEIQDYFPIIGIRYQFSEKCSDYHYAFPVVKDQKDNGLPSFVISNRTQFNGILKDYQDEAAFMRTHHLGDQCHDADVYFAPRQLLGKHVIVEKPTYNGMCKSPAGKPRRMRLNQD